VIHSNKKIKKRRVTGWPKSHY